MRRRSVAGNRAASRFAAPAGERETKRSENMRRVRVARPRDDRTRHAKGNRPKRRAADEANGPRSWKTLIS